MDWLKTYLKKYKSIEDLPIRNWIELNKGDFSYLYLHRKFWGKFMNLSKQSEMIEKHWGAIYDEFIKEIGLTDEFKDTLEQMKRVTILRCENALKPSSLANTKLAEAESILEDMTSKEGGKFQHFLAAIEKYMGIPLDMAKTSVAKFYSYVYLMEQEAKANG